MDYKELLMKIFAGEINMNITEIIKDAFLFPSKNTGRFAIYLLLSVLMVGFALGGIFTYAFGIIDAENYLMGGVYLLISLLIGCIITGYHIKIIKSGIELDDNVPVFELYKDFMTGFDNFIVSLFYFIIPALIVMLVSFDTNLFGNAIEVVKEFVLQIYGVYFMDIPIEIAFISISPLLTDFLNSLAITLTAAFIVFLIFSILQLMAEARLANTGSLKEALNIFEAVKDITRIGVGKVILLLLAVVVVIAIIEIILIIALTFYPFLLSVLYIILTPYMVLVSQRALGLLYSDIA
ncbi:MAG: DUF4013 domain-containing protein [Methanobrevibacter sp.]|uniref:DUF4013 domain-containing protein n=1 Tax=Methanobrevibacter sp. TaxID=66852 RepID=UPI0025EEADA6|nr:DUF4013 domain-containing protein [Methanobrevibacter sp.]MBR0270651.1 DUF4013 domain-containing protein [Methanobrevibacter sp.]